MKNLFACAITLVLLACTAPETPAQTVYLVQSQYAAALKVEVAYSKLPRCGQPASPKLCSDAAIVSKVKKISDSTWSAIKEAQEAVRTPGFGEDKITTIVTSARSLTDAFVEVTKTLGVE